MANGVIIAKTGTATYYYTWASLRTAFSQPDPGLIFSFEYPVMVPGQVSLKSAAAGSGLIRADRNLVNLSGSINFDIGASNSQFNPSPPPTFIVDWYLWLAWYDYVANTTLVPIELQTQLTGQTVTKSAGVSVTITSSLFTAALGRQFFLYGSVVPQGYVTAVGKLTPIT
jgi:hypothetical protein